MNTVETKIADKLVTDALAAGYAVTVWEGEDYAIKRSTDKAAIMAALASTDEDTLRFYKGGMFRGSVLLIWGNDCDLISDSTANADMQELTAGADKLAEKLAA